MLSLGSALLGKTSLGVETITLQYRVSPGKNTVDDNAASTTTIPWIVLLVNRMWEYSISVFI